MLEMVLLWYSSQRNRLSVLMYNYAVSPFQWLQTSLSSITEYVLSISPIELAICQFDCVLHLGNTQVQTKFINETIYLSKSMQIETKVSKFPLPSKGQTAGCHLTHQSVPSLTIPPGDPREFAHSSCPWGRVFAPLSCPGGCVCPGGS